MNPSPRPPRLLIFDSGVGGLSIAQAVESHTPGCELIYASDNAAFPYGTKSENELVERVDAVLHRLVTRCRPDVIVVACNSASTLALPRIRARFDEPIVGVVPAIKPAAAASRSKVIGLLATPGTVARPYTRDLIERFAADCTVIAHGSSELVTLAEAALRDRLPSPQALQHCLAPLLDHPRFAGMDQLVLACTHFPLLREPLQAIVGEAVTLVDSGEAIARRVAYWLDQLALAPGAGPAEHRALFTREGEDVESLRAGLARLGYDKVAIEPV